MSDIDETENEDLFDEFLDEADDMIAEMEQHCATLEADPGAMEAIHGIFRAAHSLKGNSSFFGLTSIQNLCHQFENYLDLIREKEIEVNEENTHFILEGGDYLKQVFGRLRNDRMAVTLQDDEHDFMQSIADRISSVSSEDRLDDLRKEFLKFFARATDDGMMDEDSPLSALQETIKRLAPTLIEDKRQQANGTGVTWRCGDLDVTREYLDMRGDIDEALAPQETTEHGSGYERFMNSLDSLIAKHMEVDDDKPLDPLQQIKDNFEIFYIEEIGIDEILARSALEQLDEYQKFLVETGAESAKEKEPSPTTGAAATGALAQGEKRIASKTIRIQERLLDRFIDEVGELITTNELFNALQRRLAANDLDGLANDMKNTNQAFADSSMELQKLLYDIRKVPFERALSKLPGIVRGITKKSGKNISITMTGGDTEVDKSLLEKIDTILLHCVRNSSDHGIESPEERRAAGKDSQGKIDIDVFAKDNRITIILKDDGRGVNVDTVSKLAVERGLYTETDIRKMSSVDKLNILMAPGFSTAEEVTETSGRGVGMDVLASSVRDMGGKITLDNFPGRGFTVTFSLPLSYTTMIKLGLTLRVGDQVYLVPAEGVRESFKVTEKDCTLVEGKGEMIQRWGSVYALLRLSTLLRIKPQHENIWDAICVLVESKGKVICLLVDDILGQRQIVYKQLGLKTEEPCAFEGISILDGRNMALILSIEGLIKQFEK